MEHQRTVPPARAPPGVFGGPVKNMDWGLAVAGRRRLSLRGDQARLRIPDLGRDICDTPGVGVRAAWGSGCCGEYLASGAEVVALDNG
jgi:hypothetical protein